MTQVVSLESRLIRVPLDGARGGSGATQVDVVLVTATDADGVSGTGFTYALTGGAEAALAMVRSTYIDEVVGSEVLEWSRVWDTLWARTHRVGRGVSLAALSAVDIAIWDLRARAAGLPLYQLLGPRHEGMEVYGSGRATNLMTTEELVSGTLEYVAEGYRAVKLRAGGRPLEEEVERMSAVRDAVGPQVRLMVDCNERLDYPSALWFGRQLAELGFFWLEEPLVSDDLEGYARLAGNLDVAIAAGEHLQGRFEFLQYLRAGAAGVLQPDAALCGGVTEFARIGTLAEAFGIPLSPHFLPELHIHLCAAAGSCTYIEHFPLIDDLFEESLEPVEGVMYPPQRPGHGIAWNEEALDRYDQTHKGVHS